MALKVFTTIASIKEMSEASGASCAEESVVLGGSVLGTSFLSSTVTYEVPIGFGTSPSSLSLRTIMLSRSKGNPKCSRRGSSSIGSCLTSFIFF